MYTLMYATEGPCASNVYFLTSSSFPKDSFKVVITNVPYDDLILAHYQFYKDECELPENDDPSQLEFQCEETLKSLDKDKLIEQLKTKPRPWFKTTEGSSDITPKNDNEFPFFSSKEMKDVYDIVETVNKLTTLVHSNKVCDKEVKESTLFVSEQVVDFQEGNLKASNDDVDAGITSNPVIPTTFVIEVLHDYLEHTPFVFSEEGFGYFPKSLDEIFPEFTINIHHNFPKFPIARELLLFCYENEADDFDCQLTIEKIRRFFGCSKEPEKKTISKTADFTTDNVQDPFLTIMPTLDNPRSNDIQLYTHNMAFPLQPILPPLSNLGSPRDLPKFPGERSTDITKDVENNQEMYAAPFAIQPSPYTDVFKHGKNTWNNETKNSNDDITIHADKRILLLEFINRYCHSFKGSKIKSSKLFEKFKHFVETKDIPYQFDHMYNSTSFTKLLKELSAFETKRGKDGIYWTDLYVGDKEDLPNELLALPKHSATRVCLQLDDNDIDTEPVHVSQFLNKTFA